MDSGEHRPARQKRAAMAPVEEPMDLNLFELETKRNGEIESEGDGEEDHASEPCLKAPAGPVDAPFLSTFNPKAPMLLNVSNLATEKKAEIESEREGKEDDKMRGIDEAPHDIENPKDPLLEELHNLFRLSPLRCIYRVPERLRRGNENAYTPQVVSIGPLHHGKPQLKAMEEHKKRYLRHFLSRTRERVSFSDYIKKIKGQERRLRHFYAEPIEFGSDEFVRIVLVDAAFVIEFLLRYCSKNCEDDYIFNKPEMLWDVRPDLRLLENQLPFFIVQDLFNTLLPSSHQLPSLLEISYNFFKSEIDSKGKEEKFKQICSFGDVQHFVDLLRILYLPLK
ncbi:UPF0481 protein At3g47200-like [Malus domestica]|uniref:UPF0481 protein At3g47200-like n=2 Tax=Malus TaxID=3749 RepID=UPI0039765421